MARCAVPKGEALRNGAGWRSTRAPVAFIACSCGGFGKLGRIS